MENYSEFYIILLILSTYYYSSIKFFLTSTGSVWFLYAPWASFTETTIKIL